MDTPSVLQLFILSVLLVALAGGLTSLMRRLGVVDRPNERSSHDRPVPRSGGVAIVATTYAGVAIVLWMQGGPVASFPQVAGIGVAGAIFAFAGFLDDLGRLRSFRSKLAFQTVGACVMFPFGVVIQTLPLPFFGSVPLGWLGYPVTLVWVLGLTNMFNFMDGLDGLAGGTAVVAAAVMVMLAPGVAAGPSGTICLVLFAAVLGFLAFNFPRAQIFLGDVGSQFLGFAFAAVAVLAADYDPAGVPILVVPLLFFHFIFDTAFTFCRRLVAREDVIQAHKSHLYQLLNQTGRSHAWVSTLHMGMALAQGVGAYVMMGLPPSRHWDVFVPFLLFEILYAVLVLRAAWRRGLL